MEQHEESSFIRKEPCPSCGSKNNLGRYDDGHGYCFGCHYREPAKGSLPKSNKGHMEETLSAEGKLGPYYEGSTGPLKSRNVNQETCERYGYRIGSVGDKTVQMAPYYKEGRIVGLKCRGKDKDFFCLGDFKNPGLFGQQLADKGKLLVVTEGEIDAMSVSMAAGNKYHAVSVPNGAQGAAKAFKANLEYFNGFEQVVIFFDMDEPGRKAALECAEILPPGKAKIVHIEGGKDANDLLQQGKVADIINAVFNAKAFRPDGIVTIADIKQAALKPPEKGLPWFLEGLTRVTYGRRYGELYCFGAGTGVGKTDLLIQQIEYDLNTLKQPVSVIFLEQAPPETLKRIAGKFAGKIFHVPEGYTQEELEQAIDQVEQNSKLFLYDSWGSTEWEVVKSKIRYLAHSEGVKLFYLDNLTALAAESEDEKKTLEIIMAQMAKLCQELDIIIHLVSHLATPEGKSHEEGGRVTIRQFKGSRSIGFWCHFIFGIERDQQAEDQKNKSLFRVLKDRLTGKATGVTIPLRYDPETGRIGEALFEPVEEEF